MALGLLNRRRFVRLICGGVPQGKAARAVGMSRRGAQSLWYRLGGPPLRRGRGGGLVTPVDEERSAGANRPLSFTERIEIMRGLDKGHTRAEIARRIDRHRSVVCREIARNATPAGDYDAYLAQAWAAHRARRPKQLKLATNPVLCRLIEDAMDAGWSPKLIADMLARWFPGDREKRVSHETIYQCLYVQTRGGLRADLAKQLSTRRTARKPRGRVSRRGTIYADAFTISDRPAEAADRAVPGHWEGDLIVGTASKSAIGTLVERSTRYTVLLHLPDGHTADQVAGAMIDAMADLPQQLRQTITWDRGSEMARHETIRMELGTPVYFCDPHSPWQRGTNENTNRLLRHWFTKGTDLSGHDAAELKRVQHLLNTRPRPTLDYDTPADRLNALIQADVALTA